MILIIPPMTDIDDCPADIAIDPPQLWDKYGWQIVWPKRYQFDG